jgi:hypothetical protein
LAKGAEAASFCYATGVDAIRSIADRRHVMPATEPRRSLEELARLGVEAFDHHVRPVLRPEDDGKFVAIDVVSGEYEIDADDYSAVTRLRARRPGAEVWLERAGRPTAYQMRRDR